MRVVSLLIVLSSLLGASLGGKKCSHCVERWRECLKKDCAAVGAPGVAVLPGSCEWDCKARRRSCFNECLKDGKEDGGSRQKERSFIIKPATMPSFEGEGDAELLVHVSSDVWSKGEYALAAGGPVWRRYHLKGRARVSYVTRGLSPAQWLLAGLCMSGSQCAASGSAP